MSVESPSRTTPRPGAGPLARSWGRPAAPEATLRESRAGYAFVSLHAVGLLLFTVVPIVLSLVMAGFDWPIVGERVFVGLGNVTELLGDRVFRAATLNTLLFVVLFVPTNLVVSLGLAAWLGPRIRGRQIFRVILFIPTITPVVANVLVWRLIFQRDGLIDGTSQAWFGVEAPNFLEDPRWAMIALVTMSVWQGFGYNMLIFSAALDAVPEPLLEAMQIDGAGPVRTFFSAQLPMISPTIFFGAIMTLITSLQVFTQPFIMTNGGPGTSTTTMMLYVYSEGFQNQAVGMAAAGAWILFILILGVTAVQFWGQRKWVHYE